MEKIVKCPFVPIHFVFMIMKLSMKLPANFVLEMVVVQMVNVKLFSIYL